MIDQNTPSPALLALQEATRDIHADLDQRSPLTAPSLGPQTYHEHAARVFGWMAPLEQQLWRGPASDLWPADMLICQRDVKVDWIRLDLLNADYNAVRLSGIPLCPYVPVPRTLAAAFGVAYVSEGATLGGAFLSSRLKEQLPDMPLHWLRGYGAETGSLWRSFQRLLAQHVVNPQAILEAQDAARDAFESFRCWVIDEKPTW